MLYNFINNILIPLSNDDIHAYDSNAPLLGIYSIDKIDYILEHFDITPNQIKSLTHWSTTNADYSNDFYIYEVNVITLNELRVGTISVIIYRDDNNLLFFTNPEYMHTLYDYIANSKHGRYSIGTILYLFFKRISYDYTILLEHLEDVITDIEDNILLSDKRDSINNLVLIRKALIILDNNFDSYNDIIDEIALEDDSNNSIITQDSKNSSNKINIEFQLIYGKFERLSERIRVLKELVSHVKEIYQTSEDLEFNRIMKVFTVITTIFLPLTLISSWYGMNVHMPEATLPYIYPIICALAITFLIIMIIIFKKKKWI